MTKQETKRAILRAFGDAAKAIHKAQRLHGRTYAFTVGQALRHSGDPLTGQTRREQTRNHWQALAAATAFGA